MSRYVTPVTTDSSLKYKPVTTPIGLGCCCFFVAPCAWSVPSTACCLRIRVWGAGSYGYLTCRSGAGCTCDPPCVNWGGFGGGFAMKTVCGLQGSCVCISLPCLCSNWAYDYQPVTSFGSYVSATAGWVCVCQPSPAVYLQGGPGMGYGGDVNYRGGCPGDALINSGCQIYYNFWFPGGGGAANVFGDGGNGTGVICGGPGLDCNTLYPPISIMARPGGGISMCGPCCIVPPSKIPNICCWWQGNLSTSSIGAIPLDFIGAGAGAAASHDFCNNMCNISLFNPTTNIIACCCCCGPCLGGTCYFGYYVVNKSCGIPSLSGGGGSNQFAASFPGGGAAPYAGGPGGGLVVVEW